MEVLKEFGVDWRLLLAQIVNFLIIFYVLKRYAYKPILTLLKKREQTIKESLEQADEARRLLEQSEQKEKEILRKAQTEAKKLLADAQKERDVALQDAKDATQKQVEKMMKEAREQITFESKEAEKRLTAHINELSIRFLQKATTDLFSEQDQEQVMKKALRKIREKAD